MCQECIQIEEQIKRENEEFEREEEMNEQDAVNQIIEARYAAMPTNGWTLVSEAVSNLIELIDDNPSFRLHRMAIGNDNHNEGTLMVAAYDESGRPFEYAMFITSRGIITDGY